MRPVARAVAFAWRQVRYRAWLALVRIRLSRRGMRVTARAARPPFMDGFPRVVLEPGAARGGTLELTLERGARLRAGLEIEVRAGVASALRIGEGARVGPGAHIKLRGGRVTLGERADLRDFVILKASGDIHIGHEAVLSYATIVSSSERISIDDQVGIGERTTIIDSDHGVDGEGTHYLYAPLRSTPIRLGPNTLVSANCVILRGVTTGHDSLVAAGAVVRRGDYPPRSILAGNPAEVVGAVGSPEQAVGST